jgi:hypothetical protein
MKHLVLILATVGVIAMVGCDEDEIDRVAEVPSKKRRAA